MQSEPSGEEAKVNRIEPCYEAVGLSGRVLGGVAGTSIRKHNCLAGRVGWNDAPVAGRSGLASEAVADR